MKAAEQMEATTMLTQNIHSALIGDPLKGEIGYLGKVDLNTRVNQDQDIKIDVLYKEIDKVKTPWKTIAATTTGGATLGAFWEHIMNFFKSV